MGHASGMIGFPLRLLARENFDKVVRIKGPQRVALLTGEEKIVPPGARYFLCTAESMPADRPVAFLAVDEVQLCADPERGHVFTDRLLRARGVHETMFMGSDTIAPLVRRLVPEAEIETRPRFSRLTYTGYKNLSRLPPKSAIVAFSAADVYAIAELIRRQKGGAAVVLGALSPRTRNAQVGLYQAGEVDYIVATDAIGMGLNMDVGHVAFAGLTKYDGRQVRPLTPLEAAQIAGRAGRYRNDGTFGVTGDTPPLDPAFVDRLEAHEFEPLRRLYWRNSRLRFSSVGTLLADLRRPPPERGLVRPEAAEDERALEFLSKDPEIEALAKDPDSVRLLWEVSQIPDFRKTLTDSHPRLLGRIFRHLRGNEGRLPTDWVARQVRRLERTDGDIDTLTHRIAGVRTWTYVSHRSGWLEDARHWQERTRSVEDRLSDALHEQLTLRFVDRRTAVLLKRLKGREELLAAVTRSGDVLVEGHFVGRLEGFHFAADDLEGAGGAKAAKAVNAAALRALRTEMVSRVKSFCEEPGEAFELAEDGLILWREAPVGRLRAGPVALRPRVETLPFDLVGANDREEISDRLARWFEEYRGERLGPLLEAESAGLEGAARGLAFQLLQGLGSVPRRQGRPQIESLTEDDRRRLRRLGVRFARASVYFPSLLRPSAVSLRAVLWTVHRRPEVPGSPPPAGTRTVDVETGTPLEFYEAVGYRVCGTVAVRLDALEAVAAAAWERSKKGAFPLGGSLLTQAGSTISQLGEILQALGYALQEGEDGALTASRGSRRGGKTAAETRKGGVPGGRGGRKFDPNSPFAKLGALKLKGQP